MTTTAEVELRYAQPRDPVVDDRSFALGIPTDEVRPAGLEAQLHRPAVIRDALLTVADVLASDLRFITMCLKVVTDLERMGDLVVNICERVVELNEEPAPGALAPELGQARGFGEVLPAVN